MALDRVFVLGPPSSGCPGTPVRSESVQVQGRPPPGACSRGAPERAISALSGPWESLPSFGRPTPATNGRSPLRDPSSPSRFRACTRPFRYPQPRSRDEVATLLRDREQPHRFISFGPWDSLEQIAQWRSSVTFKEGVGGSASCWTSSCPTRWILSLPSSRRSKVNRPRV
jgi:hypothetical protein